MLFIIFAAVIAEPVLAQAIYLVLLTAIKLYPTRVLSGSRLVSGWVRIIALPTGMGNYTAIEIASNFCLY